ncbi:MAG: threonine ammonia-lyase [Bdellovibrionales bacterium]|nr:threonine ammonia-lyase [Bdellovibrionales bacterium]
MKTEKAKKKSAGVTLASIREAADVLRAHLLPSPLLYNPWMSSAYGCEIYLKLENMQPIGSFKIRGATNKIAQLSPAERKRGVIAASAGNHAQGVAWGARKLGVKATIVMPKGAPIVKVQNTESLGAEVLLAGDTYDECSMLAQKLAKKTGKVLVHAFDDDEVIAGQGTAALEILEQLPDVDAVICSVGGGGLLAGVATVMKELRPKTKIFGAQASGAPAMAQSLKKGRPVTLDRVETFADGIAVGGTRKRTFDILRKRVDRVLLADDESIAAAILTLAEKAKVVSEGAGAVSVAVLDQVKKELKGKKVVIVVGGGNIDVNVLNRVIDRGLIRKGRRLRVNVLISDRPGSLARLTAKIAEAGANVIQAIHDRSEPSTTLDRTEVALTLETRGHEHSAEVIKALRKEVLDLHVVH